jgi:poly-beta-1,6-N-acetyl-D-glucosamine biosynthesis protein PgaD
MNHSPPRLRIPAVILHPELVPPGRKGLMVFLGSLGWAIWFHLMLPLLALLAWTFGIRRFRAFVLTDVDRTFHTLLVYALVVAASGAVFLLWSIYNWLRFRHRGRRGSPAQATPGDLAQAYQVEEAEVLRAQALKSLDVAFDDQGRIVRVDAHVPQSVPAP